MVSGLSMRAPRSETAEALSFGSSHQHGTGSSLSVSFGILPAFWASTLNRQDLQGGPIQ